jgi:hypothetical protein
MSSPIFNRVKKVFKIVTLPKVVTIEDYGVKDCCDVYNVFAEINKTDDWKNDVTSAWAKLFEQADTATFVLKKNGVAVTNYILVKKSFDTDREQYSKYVTINWSEVLALEGIGCYTLEVTSVVSGFTFTTVWGMYNLQVYSTMLAKNQIRVKAVFNQFHTIEDIDFTNSNVVDTLRVFGMFGNRKPNFAIDNLINQKREVKNVVREQLNNYELLTDPIKSNYTSKLLDLYLLSETDLFITDHNDFNHVQTYKDFNVIVEDSPEVDYKNLSNLASVKCVVSDKIKNKRSYYNG